MNLEIDGTKKILLVEESQGYSLHTDSKQIAVAIGGIPVEGPRGFKGDKGDQGDTGIVTASLPLIYNSSNRTISADTGTGPLQIVLGSDARLSDNRIPSDASITDAKINSTLSQSKVTNLTSDLSTLTTNVNGKASLVHTHVITDVTNLSSTLTGKQSTSEKNQANGYVGLNSSSKIDSSYLPIQRSTLIENASSDLEFTTKASQSRFQIGDKLIKTGGSTPAQGTYLRTNTVNGGWNSNPSLSDWILEAVGGGISEIQTVPGGSKVGASVTISYTDIGAAPTSHTHTLSQITDVGNSASKNTGTTSGTVAAGDDSRIIGAAQKSSNLSDLTSVSTARSNLGLGDSATKNVGTSSNQVAAGAHPHVFRTSHNFIIQGNIVTSGLLAVPPFFTIHGWPAVPAGSSELTQGDTSMKLVEIWSVTTSGSVNFQIYKINDNNPINTGSNTTVLLPVGGTLGNNISPTPLQAATTVSRKDNNDFTPISIDNGKRIGIYITGINSGPAPQNLTVTLVFEHRLN